jgi:hypothetical protein
MYPKWGCTVGVFGFTEKGLLPAPQALLSLLAETGTLLLLALWQTTVTGRHRAARPSATAPTGRAARGTRPPQEGRSAPAGRSSLNRQDKTIAKGSQVNAERSIFNLPADSQS